MIVDYSKMKELEDKIGNYSGAPRTVPDLINTVIIDVTKDCQLVEDLMAQSKEIMMNYKETTNKKSEDNFIDELSSINSQINRLFTKQNKAIQVIRDQVHEEKGGIEDSEDLDPEIIMKDNLSKSL